MSPFYRFAKLRGVRSSRTVIISEQECKFVCFSWIIRVFKDFTSETPYGVGLLVAGNDPSMKSSPLILRVIPDDEVFNVIRQPKPFTALVVGSEFFV